MTSTERRKARARPRSWRGWVAAALLATAAGVLVWLGTSSAPEPRGPSQVQPGATEALRPAPQPPVVAPNRPAPALTPAEPPMEESFKQLELSAAEARLRQIRMRRAYPLWTQPLDQANVWSPPEPYLGSSSDQNPGGRIFVMAERAQADLGSTVRIFVKAIGADGQPAPISGLEGHTLEGWSGRAPHPRIALSFGDDGAGGDERAGDLVYTGVLAVPQDRSNAGDWTVAVEGTIGSDRRGASTVVLFEPNDARFTGEFSEEMVDGSIVVHAGVEIIEPTFTHVRLELFAGDQPIAQAWAAQTPDAAGQRTFDVTFYGKVIRDAGLNGPYTVRHAILTTQGSGGRFPGTVVDPVLVTRPYPLEAFTDRNKNEGNALLDEQERLALEDIEAARHGDPSDQPQARRMTLIDKYNTPIPQ